MDGFKTIEFQAGNMPLMVYAWPGRGQQLRQSQDPKGKSGQA
jgi:hypothetical protein